MSLAIDIDRVGAVLLADGWHGVKDRSFDVDAYEYGQWDEANIFNRLVGTGTGARWVDTDTGFSIAVPLSSILAVRY